MCSPLIELLRMADSGEPSTGKMYWGWYQLVEERWPVAAGLSAAQRREVTKLANKRWEMLHSPLHSAGYTLDPEFWDHAINGVEVCSAPLTCSSLLHSSEH